MTTAEQCDERGAADSAFPSGRSTAAARLSWSFANTGDHFAMGLLSDFFIADATPVPNYDGGESVSDCDKCQFKNLTPLQAAQFLAVLRGQEYVIEMIREFELVTPEDADDWTMIVPDDMAIALAKIEGPGIADTAARFADVTSEELGWSPDDFVPIVSALSELAKRAIATQKKMYLWNCL